MATATITFIQARQIDLGFPWADPTNALTSNDQYATNTVDAPEASNYLIVYDGDGAIPDGSTIDGVTVHVEGLDGTTSNNGLILAAVLRDASTWNNTGATMFQWIAGGDYLSDVESVVDVGTGLAGWQASGSVALTLTAGQVNSSDFGILVSITAESEQAMFSLDSIKATITYTEAASGISDNLSGDKLSLSRLSLDRLSVSRL